MFPDRFIFGPWNSFGQLHLKCYTGRASELLSLNLFIGARKTPREVNYPCSGKLWTYEDDLLASIAIRVESDLIRCLSTRSICEQFVSLVLFAPSAHFSRDRRTLMTALQRATPTTHSEIMKSVPPFILQPLTLMGVMAQPVS
jgi:hypothetical protein